MNIKQMKKLKPSLVGGNWRIIQVGGIILVAVLITLVYSVYARHVSDTTRAETERYLGEISHIVADEVNERLSNNFRLMESIGATYLEMDGQADAVHYLESKTNLHEFTRITAVDVNGDGYTSNGETVHIGGDRYFESTLRGEQIFAHVQHSPVDGTMGVLYSIPLKENGQIVGALMVWNSQDFIEDVLSIEVFGGQAYTHIIDTKGEFIVKAANLAVPNDGTNFFTMLRDHGTIEDGKNLDEIIGAIAREDTGSFRYRLDQNDVSKSAYFFPLEHGELMLLSVVPSNVTSEHVNRLVQEGVTLSFLLLGAFTVLIIFVLAISAKSNKKLMELAFVDPLTHGMNRVRFDMEARTAIARSKPGTYCFIVVNIKRFKLINDLFGSTDGDKVIRYVYNCIAPYLGADEFVCHDTGDQYYVLSKKNNKEDILRCFETVSRKINEYNGRLKQKFFLKFSIGVYQIDDTSVSLTYCSDRANLARKAENAGMVCDFFTCTFYSDVERMRIINENHIENTMEDALEAEEFVIFLQPKIELENQKVVGAEALVRWEDGKGGYHSPKDFIPVFEKNGFVIKLDIYVFEKTCALLQRWIEHGYEPVPISVNLSRAHLVYPNFLEKYIELKKKYNIPDKLIEIELTESLVFENLEVLIDVVNQIHNAGFKCALDDFGSGYSSLNALKDIHVDTLKLDGAFWHSSNGNEKRERDIIEVVIDLAKKLDMTTVSEGVESTDQLEFLRHVRCDMVQGYVFSKPIPCPEFERIAFGECVPEDNTQSS